MSEPSNHRLLRIIALVTFVFGLAHIGLTATSYDDTYDEMFHLEWSERFVRQPLTERLSEPYFNSKTPFTAPSSALRIATRSLLPDNPTAERLAGRSMTMLWFVGLVVVARRFLSRHVSPASADLATILICLDPSLVAHSAITTVDVPFALGTLLTLTVIVAFWTKPTLGRAVALGGALGFAITAKYSAVLLFPLVLAAPVVGLRPQRSPAARTLALLSVAAVTFWAFVCLSYGFVGVGQQATFEWRTSTFQWLSQHAPMLLNAFPVDFWSGIDITTHEDQNIEWNSILFNQTHPNGVWYYFVVVALTKTPLTLLLAAGLGLTLCARRLRSSPRVRLVFLALVWLSLYFSLVFRTQVGYRFVLMCLPIAYVLAAEGLARLLTAPRFLHALGGLLALYAVELVPFFGNPMSFTNTLIQPKKNAYKVLADSNIDFGQHDDRVRRRVDRARSRGKPVFLNPLHPQPGINIVPINYYTGVFWGEVRSQMAMDRDPDRHLWHTHLVFDIDDDEFAELLDTRRRLAAHPGDQAFCDMSRPIDLAGARTRITLSQRGVCVRVAEPTPVKIDVEEGMFVHRSGERFFHYDADELDSYGRRVRHPDHLWFTLEPGVHTFFNGRAGRWAVEGDGLELFALRTHDEALEDIDVPPECAEGRPVRDVRGRQPQLYVRGNWNGWLPYAPGAMAYVDGCYVAQLFIPEELKVWRPQERRTELKIGPVDWVGQATFGSAVPTDGPRGPFSEPGRWVEVKTDDETLYGGGGNLVFPPLNGERVQVLLLHTEAGSRVRVEPL